MIAGKILGPSARITQMHHNFASYSAAEIVPPNKHHTTTFPASCQNRLGGIETRLLELKSDSNISTPEKESIRGVSILALTVFIYRLAFF